MAEAKLESKFDHPKDGILSKLFGGRSGWKICLAIVLALVVVGGIYGYNAFFREVPQEVCGDVEEANKASLCASDAEEKFKYGSLGSEEDRGLPYPLFHVLPRAMPDLLPGPGGYRSLGIPWEQGRELPVGFSKKVVGFPRITQNCAVCHTSTYRTSVDATPVVVPTGPSHTSNVQGFLDFLEKAGRDPRFSADVLMPQIEQSFELSFLEKLAYRYLIIPIARKRIVEQAETFAWMRAHGRPDWGPGRDDPMNLTKFFMIEMEDDGTTGNADFPSIWNMNLRENTSMNWAGETLDPLAVFIDSALGLGAPPGEPFMEQMRELREYLRAKQPPPFPFDIDQTLADAGKPVFAEHCGDCHSEGGTYFGGVVPIDEIGTDRERFDTWQQEHADEVNRVAKEEMGVDRKDMIKDVGYASQPLDGIWLRAPYLHNGSVPGLRDLLTEPDRRPKVFYRGCDLYDPDAMSFVSSGPSKACPRVFMLDTRERGNGNGGHTYGIELSAAEKDALVEYMKTF